MMILSGASRVQCKGVRVSLCSWFPIMHLFLCCCCCFFFSKFLCAKILAFSFMFNPYFSFLPQFHVVFPPPPFWGGGCQISFCGMSSHTLKFKVVVVVNDVTYILSTHRALWEWGISCNMKNYDLYNFVDLYKCR